jgi:membrane protein required for colicin V production
MNWVDLVVLAVLALSGLLAFMRGLVREALGLGAWVVAGLAASSYGAFPYVLPWVTANIVAFGGVFVLVLIMMWMVAGALSSLVRGSMLGGLDRTLGLVFGLARGAVLLAVAYVLAGMAIPAEQWPAPVIDARSLPAVHRGAEWIAAQIPPAYRPVVAAPPTGRATTSASLLQSKPDGRALSARPARE